MPTCARGGAAAHGRRGNAAHLRQRTSCCACHPWRSLGTHAWNPVGRGRHALDPRGADRLGPPRATAAQRQDRLRAPDAGFLRQPLRRGCARGHPAAAARPSRDACRAPRVRGHQSPAGAVAPAAQQWTTSCAARRGMTDGLHRVRGLPCGRVGTARRGGASERGGGTPLPPLAAGTVDGDARVSHAAALVMPLLRQPDAYLEEALRSLVHQTVPADVIVVISPRTPASNLELLERFARRLGASSRDAPGGCRLSGCGQRRHPRGSCRPLRDLACRRLVGPGCRGDLPGV